MGEKTKRLAMVASKGTLDQAYPPLILATTAAAMGWEVGIFFTFYGLDILHKKRLEHLQVSPVGNPAMPPPIPAIPMLKVPTFMGALPGMTAMATTMMKGWMAKAKLPTVKEMLDLCVEADVQLFACSTTMGVMGITQGELIPQAQGRGSRGAGRRGQADSLRADERGRGARAERHRLLPRRVGGGHGRGGRHLLHPVRPAPSPAWRGRAGRGRCGGGAAPPPPRHFLDRALDRGVKLYACQPSLDLNDLKIE